MDDLTPLDARNSLLNRPTPTPSHTYDMESKRHLTHSSVDSFANDPANPYSSDMHLRPYGHQDHIAGLDPSRERLVRDGSPPGPRNNQEYDMGYGRYGGYQDRV